MKKFVPNKGIIELGDGGYIENGEFKTRIDENDNKYLTLEECRAGLKKLIDITSKMIVDEDEEQNRIKQNMQQNRGESGNHSDVKKENF